MFFRISMTALWCTSKQIQWRMMMHGIGMKNVGFMRWEFHHLSLPTWLQHSIIMIFQKCVNIWKPTLDETSDYELVKTEILEKMFVNPYASWQPNVYAILPSHASLPELDKCMPTSKLKAIQRVFSLPKQKGKKETLLETDTNLLIPDGSYQTVYVTWVSRTCQGSGSNKFDVDMLDLCLAWSQRHNASTRLIDHIFIIPTYILTRLATSMYLRYYCSCLQSKEVTEIEFNEFEEMEFMECVPIVLKYLSEKMVFESNIHCLSNARHWRQLVVFDPGQYWPGSSNGCITRIWLL